jgi:hypothetical protein
MTDSDDTEGIDALAEIAEEAAGSAEYRGELIANPREKLEKAGLRVPKDVQIVIHQNQPGLIHLVLPLPADALPDVEVPLAPSLYRSWCMTGF